jgi:hypothetical protein
MEISHRATPQIVFTDDVLAASLHQFGHFLCNGVSSRAAAIEEKQKRISGQTNPWKRNSEDACRGHQ